MSKKFIILAVNEQQFSELKNFEFQNMELLGGDTYVVSGLMDDSTPDPGDSSDSSSDEPTPPTPPVPPDPPTPPDPPVPPTPTEWWGLKFTAREAGSTVSLTNVNYEVEDGPKFQKSSDNGETWEPLALNDVITLTNVGDEICISATDEGNESLAVDSGGCVPGYTQFVMTGSISASGDVTSLLDNKNSVTDLTDKNYVFYMLFSDCSSLITPPELPSINLADNCYESMFQSCTSLTTAPALPATVLANYCYQNMFSRCTSLATAPELPATTLFYACYVGMFSGCTALNSITVGFTEWDSEKTNNWLNDVASFGNFNCPESLVTTVAKGPSTIPENWLINGKYWGLTFTAEQSGSTIKMESVGDFGELPKLQTSVDGGRTWVPFVVDETVITLSSTGDRVLFAATDEGNSTFCHDAGCSMAYISFVMNGKITASGDISSLLNNKKSVTDLNNHSNAFENLFNNCSSLHNAGELILPATILSDSCYKYMFDGCTSLTTAPVLPAVTLATDCYTRMFDGCISLSSVEVAFIDWINTENWLNNVSNYGTFRCPTALGTNETIDRGESYCPINWTVENID